MADPTQNGWIRRVLGVAIDTADATQAAPATPVWMDAKEEVDAGISQLQAAMRSTGDADLIQIAEYGLNGATDGQSVKLMVALREADAAQSAQTRAKLAAAVTSFRSFLDGSRIIELIEDNPFGVAVPIRRRLSAALDEIARAA